MFPAFKLAFIVQVVSGVMFAVTYVPLAIVGLDATVICKSFNGVSPPNIAPDIVTVSPTVYKPPWLTTVIFITLNVNVPAGVLSGAALIISVVLSFTDTIV